MLDYLNVPSKERTFAYARFASSHFLFLLHLLRWPWYHRFGRASGIPFGETAVLFPKILTAAEEAALAAVKAKGDQKSNKAKKAKPAKTATPVASV
jgi:hypothetical protein